MKIDIVLLIFLGLSFGPDDICCYQDGARVEQCVTMAPDHGSSPQTDDPPYNIDVSENTYEYGQFLEGNILKHC